MGIDAGTREPTLPSDTSIGMPVVAAMLAWLAIVELTVVAGWIVDRAAVNAAIWIASGVVSVGAVWATGWTRGPRVVGWSILAIVASGLLAMLSHDFSADGQSYHQEAIVGIASGWNPLRSPIYTGPYSIWISHYAKGPWLLGASALSLTNNIEVGKGVIYILMAAVGLTGYALAKACACKSRWLRVSFGALLAFNPVVCYQLQTYYVDGQMGLLIGLLALLSALVCLCPGRSVRVALAAACVLVVNAKLSALPMAIILMLAAAAGLVALRSWTDIRRLFPATVAGLLIGLAIGVHPYVTNLIDKGHPFYPLAGVGKVDILTGNVSAEFLAKNRFEKMALSLGSASESKQVAEAGGDVGQFRWKPPFVVFPSEIRSVYKSTDLRIGGFGPWMSGTLLLTGLSWIGLLATGWLPDARQRTVLVFLGALCISVLVMPEAWWARYAPQAWTVVVMLIYLPLMQRGHIMTRLSWMAMFAATVNIMLVLIPVLANRFVSEMDWLAQARSLVLIGQRVELQVQLPETSTRIRLQESGIRFSEGAGLNCSGVTDRLIGTSSSLCIPRESVAVYQRGSPWIARVLGRTP